LNLDGDGFYITNSQTKPPNSATYKLQVDGAILASGGSASANFEGLTLLTTANTVNGIGQQINFKCYRSDSTTIVSQASIQTIRENTAQDYSSGLAFSTLTGVELLTEKMRITASGNVGIGTTTPSYKLDVSGNANITGALTSASITTTGILTSPDITLNKAYTQSGLWETSNMLFSTGNGTNAWSVGSITGYILANNGTLNNFPGGLAFKTKPANNLADANLTTRMVIDANGNVGINNTNPQYKLDVSGTANFTDTLSARNKVYPFYNCGGSIPDSTNPNDGFGYTAGNYVRDSGECDFFNTWVGGQGTTPAFNFYKYTTNTAVSLVASILSNGTFNATTIQQNGTNISSLYAPLTNPTGGQNNYAPLASPTFSGTLTLLYSSTNLLYIKPGYKGNNLSDSFVTYDIPNRGTHYFWDDVEVANVLYVSGGINTNNSSINAGTGTLTCGKINASITADDNDNNFTFFNSNSSVATQIEVGKSEISGCNVFGWEPNNNDPYGYLGLFGATYTQICMDSAGVFIGEIKKPPISRTYKLQVDGATYLNGSITTGDSAKIITKGYNTSSYGEIYTNSDGNTIFNVISDGNANGYYFKYNTNTELLRIYPTEIVASKVINANAGVNAGSSTIQTTGLVSGGTGSFSGTLTVTSGTLSNSIWQYSSGNCYYDNYNRGYASVFRHYGTNIDNAGVLSLSTSGVNIGNISVDYTTSIIVPLNVSGKTNIGPISSQSSTAQLSIYESTGTGPYTQSSVGATPTLTSINTGSLVISHNNNSLGTSSIVFPSNYNNGSDFGYIQYFDNVNNGASTVESGLLVIGIENDYSGSAGPDRISLYSCQGSGYVGVNTFYPAYSLDVNGTLNATTILQNGTNISSLYAPLASPTFSGIVTANGGINMQQDNTILYCGTNVNNCIICLYGDSNLTSKSTDYYGFGINNSTLRYNSQSAHTFYSRTTNTATISSNGTVTAASFNSTSDYRIKEDIKPISDSLDKLNPIKYYNTKLEKEDMGFLAHEVQEEFPFLVSGEKDGEDMQSLNYQGLIALLVKEVQDLKRENKLFKDKIEKLEDQFKVL